MSLLLITSKATADQMRDMLESLGSYIKLAVDIEREILAGGGQLHSDCEEVLMDNGSEQKNVWGADWVPFTQEVTFESLINIRPNMKNYSMEIQDENIRSKIEAVVRNLMEDVSYE